MQHPVHQTASLILIDIFPYSFGGLCSHIHSYQFHPEQAILWFRRRYISCFSVFTQVQCYFSLPEGLLAALGLLPMWFSLVSLFPSSCSPCSSSGLFSHGLLLSFLTYQCFLRCQWRLLNSLQAFLTLSVSSSWKFEALYSWRSCTPPFCYSKAYSVNSVLAYFILFVVLFPVLWNFIAEISALVYMPPYRLLYHLPNLPNS